jgi:hypothetical protein
MLIFKKILEYNYTQLDIIQILFVYLYMQFSITITTGDNGLTAAKENENNKTVNQLFGK